MLWWMHESRVRLVFDSIALKNPAGHISHWGWAITLPTTLVYLPAGQLVWAAQESISVPLIDRTALNFPGGHKAHSGWAVGSAFTV